MPSIISWGTRAESATSVPATAALAPGLPPTRSTGDWLFCFTTSTSTTATVAMSGWQALWNVVATNGRLACFGLQVTGSEVAPTVTWSGLTTGNSGTPCLARLWNYGTGFLENAGDLVVDAVGPASNLTSAVTNAGGASFTTVGSYTYIFAHCMRLEASLTSVTDAGGEPVAWLAGQADTTLSGADMASFVSYGDGPPAGSVINDHTWTVTGGSSVASSGVMVAMALIAPVDDVDRLVYTKKWR